MNLTSERLVLVFAGLGHALYHVLAALFLTLALVLATAWGLPYNDVIALWTVGALLVGAGAPIAGWLGDRLGETRVMIVFFIGIGAASIFCGLADGPEAIRWGLAGLGLFGSIYHPVGTAWVVKNVQRRGQSIAAVGIAGSIGVAVSSVIAGALTDLASWRVAFIVPGIITVAAGLLLTAAYALGRVVDRGSDLAPAEPPLREDVVRAFFVLVVSMALTTIAWHAFGAMLPKWMEREVGNVLGSGLAGVGALVTLIYLAGACAQFVGGHFADRGRAREIYAASFALKLAALLAATLVGGPGAILAAIVITFVFDIAAPVENVLIARYTSARRRGLAYGLRHGIAIAAAPLGVGLVSVLYDPVAGFGQLFMVLAGIVLVILIAALLLPTERPAAEMARGPAS
jgi:MFS family permease